MGKHVYTRAPMLTVNRKYTVKAPRQQSEVRKTVINTPGGFFEKKSKAGDSFFAKKARSRASEVHAELCKQREALVDAGWCRVQLFTRGGARSVISWCLLRSVRFHFRPKH